MTRTWAYLPKFPTPSWSSGATIHSPPKGRRSQRPTFTRVWRYEETGPRRWVFLGEGRSEARGVAAARSSPPWAFVVLGFAKPGIRIGGTKPTASF